MFSHDYLPWIIIFNPPNLTQVSRAQDWTIFGCNFTYWDLCQLVLELKIWAMFWDQVIGYSNKVASKQSNSECSLNSSFGEHSQHVYCTFNGRIVSDVLRDRIPQNNSTFFRLISYSRGRLHLTLAKTDKHRLIVFHLLIISQEFIAPWRTCWISLNSWI